MVEGILGESRIEENETFGAVRDCRLTRYAFRRRALRRQRVHKRKRRSWPSI